MVAKLSPVIVGWAAHYRIGVSKRAFNTLDAHVWRLVYKWARFTHANKPTRWMTTRYFGKFNPSRGDSWVFGSRKTGFYLRKFAWTAIVRHRMVAGAASPDDPSPTDYWATRRRRGNPRWARPRCACCRLSVGDARYAEGCCCTPNVSHKARSSGNSGLRLLARRSANTRSPCGALARRTNASQTVS